MWRNPELFECGIQEIEVSGVTVRVTDPARTVVDLFRSQNRIPDERAIEALGLYLDQGGSPDDVLGRAESLGASAHISHYLRAARSEEHTSELQSLMRNSYAVFCLQ